MRKKWREREREIKNGEREIKKRRRETCQVACRSRRCGATQEGIKEKRQYCSHTHNQAVAVHMILPISSPKFNRPKIPNP
jgi:hypothetical protein